MNDFLRSQVSQRASNSDRVSQLISQTKGSQFENWREDADKLFQSKLQQYSDDLQGNLQKELSAKSEGVGILTSVPDIYKLGQGGYKNVLGSYGKGVFDRSAVELNKGKDKVNSFIERKVGVNVEKGAKNISNRVGQIKDQLNGKPRQLDMGVPVQAERTEPRQASEDMSGITTRATEPGGENRAVYTQEQGIVSNPETETRDAMANVSTKTNATADVSSAVKTESKITSAADDVGNVIGKVEPIAAATEETPPGMALAGALAVVGGLAFGIDELFGHHSHKPKKPQLPTFSSGVVNTPYNISATILPNVSSQTQQQGTTTF